MISTKEQRIATAGTAIFCVLFLFMLILVRFINDPTEEEEGVLVNFGDTEQGMGEVEPRPAVAQNIPTPPPTPTPPEPAPQQTGEEEVVNQDFEESAVIEQKKKIEQKKRQDEELKRQQEIERQRIEEERRKEEERKRQEEIQRQQQQMADAQNKAKNAFHGKNPNGGNTGEGNTGQPGNQGSLNGDPNSTNRVGGGSGNGIKVSFGRSSVSDPPIPKYESKSEGKVVVEIQVDRDGKVIKASAGKKGSTTNDPILRKAAEESALKAKFAPDPNAGIIQYGTITYTFIQQE